MLNPGKKKGESLYRSILTQRPPSFFKLYVPGLNSNKLLIPPPFVDYLRGIPQKVKLKNMCGKVWTANLEVIDDSRVYITQGWEKFTTDHSLVFGDFMIFQYQEKNMFYVKVFSTNGCIKESPADEKLCNGLAEANLGDDAIIRFTKTFMKNYTDVVGVPKHVIDACAHELPQEIILRNKANKNHYTRTLLRETADRVVLGYSGLTVFWRETGVRPGDMLEFEVILGSGKKIEEFLVNITPKVKGRIR